MSNIVEYNGFSQRDLEFKIGDMVAGMVGYTVEWAVQDGELNEEFILKPSSGGTFSMKVECVEPHQYKITYEKPIYRNPLAEWQAEINNAVVPGTSFIDDVKTFFGIGQ